MFLPVAGYDLKATLDGGQAFRWHGVDGAWEGVVQGRWVRLRAVPGGLEAQAAQAVPDWEWLRHYLALDEDWEAIRATFPPDEPMQRAVAACPGLRLLRQDPWECLASFICSSTKQVVQIQEMVALLSGRLGDPVAVPPGHRVEHAFPSPAQVAGAGEAFLRGCKLGFRAPYLLGTARQVAGGRPDLEALRQADLPTAREALMSLPGVGRKIADCVLLFGYGRQQAFPVDVWVERVLRRLYFPRARRLAPRRLRHFSETHFGPWAGYAQQYLFHYARVHLGRGAERWSADSRTRPPGSGA